MRSPSRPCDGGDRAWLAWLILWALVVGAAPAAARESRRVFEVEPFLVPTTSAELEDDTRPVARDALREGTSVAVRAAGGVVGAEARLEAWVGVRGARGGEWHFELVARSGEASATSRLVLGPTAAAGWHRIVLDPKKLVGREVRVELRARPRGAEGEGTPLLGAPRWLVARFPEKPVRNVVLVSLDTLRPDRMSMYGASRPTTPRMDELADEGVRFESALAPATSTPPSHMTMLTGTEPCRHGVWGVRAEDTMSDEIDTLAEHLSRAGYTTAAVTENAYMSPPYGFARGFDSFVELKQMVADGNSPAPGIITPTGYGPKTFRAAETWIRENRDRRFFLFVHTYQVHGPRRPAGAYAKLFDEPVPTPQRGPTYDPAFHDLRRYDQLVRQLDDLVAGLVRQMTSLGLGDETILVLTSDHGEAFFEHGDHGHGWSVYGEVLRVPLIVWAPGLAKPGVVREPVGLVDIVPTVLDLLGLPLPAVVDGTSLAGAVRNPSGAEPPRRTLYAETAPGNARAVRSGSLKIVRRKGEVDALFELDRDPGEAKPIDPAAITGARVAALRAELDRRADACDAGREAAADRRDATAPLDPERRKKLEALGYAE